MFAMQLNKLYSLNRIMIDLNSLNPVKQIAITEPHQFSNQRSFLIIRPKRIKQYYLIAIPNALQYICQLVAVGSFSPINLFLSVVNLSKL